jgi:hypothetical protein
LKELEMAIVKVLILKENVKMEFLKREQMTAIMTALVKIARVVMMVWDVTESE